MNFTKIFEPLMKYVGEQNTTFRSAFAAFILATVISAVLFAILHLSVDHQGQPFIRDDGDFRVTLAIVFVALFTTFFIVMTIVSRREADDLLTPYRKQIEGVYNVLFTINEVDRSSGAIKRVGRQATCVIRINVAGKLNLQFDVINSDLFVDHTYQVEHVFLNLDTRMKQLHYFTERNFYLQPDVMQALGETRREVRLRECALLEFDASGADVQTMLGTWFDVDGSLGQVANDYASKLTPDPNLPSRHMGEVRFTKLANGVGG